MIGKAAVLLTALQTTGTAVAVLGGQYVLEGTDIGANDVVLQFQLPDDSWVDTDVVLPSGTAKNVILGTLPQGQYRAYVSVAGPRAWLTSVRK